MRRLLSLILTVLVVIGVWRGIVNYNDATGDNLLGRLGATVINTVADVTYNWLPWAVNKIGGDLPHWIPAPPK